MTQSRAGGAPSLQYSTRDRRRRWIPGWRAGRRLVQIAALGLFLALFRLTDYPGQDVLAAPVHLFFRLDPLVAASAMLAARQVLGVLWPAVVTLLVTLVLARAFCGWFCPLGTVLDLFHRLTRPLARRLNARFNRPWLARLRPIRYALLLAVLITALLGLPLVGYLDPFAILTRAAALIVDPAFYTGGQGFFDAADAHRGFWSRGLDSLYPAVRDHVLPFQHKAYILSITSGIILGVLLTLELVAQRFWCRYLCPLGAGLGLVARLSPLHRLPARNCGRCPAAADCRTSCRMGAFNSEGRLAPESCNLCMDCVGDCPHDVAHFTFRRSRTPLPPVDLSRRAALATFAVAVTTPAIVRAARLGRSSAADPDLLRPPGVTDEAKFLDLCVRCGLCLKACPTNGLQPAVLRAGIEGIFSPQLMPRVGYCEVNCTLCSQVCPTGAIPRLTMDAKAKTIIGKAVFDLDRCLPYAKNEECICCEEHCPVQPDKAIQFDLVIVKGPDGQPVTLQRPWVNYDACIGCGICQNKCPVEGDAAIRVRRTEAVPRPAPHVPPTTAPADAGLPTTLPASRPASTWVDPYGGG